MSVCGAISAGVSPNCSSPMINGDEVTVYLGNRLDIASYSFGTNPLVIENITMVATKVFYPYVGLKNSNNSKTDLVKLKYTAKYNHELNLIVFNVDAVTKTALENMANGSIVAIVEHKHKGASGESAFEVFGREQGMELTVLTRDQSNADNVGGYAITLASPSGFPESHLPAPLFDTDYATTLAIVNGLV